MAAQKLTIRSTIDPEFTIEVDERVILLSTILQEVQVHTNDSGEVPLEMTEKQLQQFVEFCNHFPSPTAEIDGEWTNQFFEAMSEQEFKDLCWKADYLNCQRFLEASAIYILNKHDQSTVEDIQGYLNVFDDYTAEERKAMNEHPLEYFSGIDIPKNDDEAVPSTSGVPPAIPNTSAVENNTAVEEVNDIIPSTSGEPPAPPSCEEVFPSTSGESA